MRERETIIDAWKLRENSLYYLKSELIDMMQISSSEERSRDNNDINNDNTDNDAHLSHSNAG